LQPAEARIAMFGRSKDTDPNDDFFKDTRMSFGDHLEELRMRMWLAIKGLLLCLVIGFILDNVGDQMEQPWIGVGKPMLKIITGPVEEQVKEFNHQRNENLREKLVKAREKSADDKLNRTVDVRTKIPTKVMLDTFEGLKLKDPEQENIVVDVTFVASDVYAANNEGEYLSDTRNFLTGLGVMEAFWVYFKVSLLCGVVIACPWLFYQFWAFVGAGLYPHEKKLVHYYMPFSIALFLIGILLCQFIVLPRAVSAMLSFYKWINVDPDLRLNEWLGFAIAMPFVFGLSFQTPLIMLFFNRIGMFTWQNYLAKWRVAIMTLAVMSAMLTPSTDVISMLWLFIPTMGLYMLGVGICRMMPPPQTIFGPMEPEDEVGV
jgi:sec-independent protein translocase protein TatC